MGVADDDYSRVVYICTSESGLWQCRADVFYELKESEIQFHSHKCNNVFTTQFQRLHLKLCLHVVFKVTGYSLGRVPHSKCETRSAYLHQTTATKDGAQIEKHLVRTHSQKE